MMAIKICWNDNHRGTCAPTPVSVADRFCSCAGATAFYRHNLIKTHDFMNHLSAEDRCGARVIVQRVQLAASH